MLAARGDPPPPLLESEPPPAAASAPAPQPPLLSPADGATTSQDRPRIEARLPAPAGAGRFSLSLDAADVTGVAEVVGATIAYQPARPLSPGTHLVRLVIDGAATTWRFTVQPGASAETPATGGPRAEWSVKALGALTHQQASGGAADTTARLLVNSRASLQGERWYARETADLSLRQGLEGTTGFKLESRSYTGALGVRAGGYGAELQAGYFVPEFLDQSRLLTVGLPGGGVEARASAPGFTIGAYQNYDSRPAGVVAGTPGPSQSLRAAGAEAAIGGRLTVRVMALQATDQADASSAGGSGTAFGLLGRAVLGPAATIFIEAAQGKYTPNPGGPLGDRSGLALRLGLAGAAGGWGWTLDLRRTEDGYVNPANRGFAAGAATDRSGGDATVSKQLGPVSIGASLRHIQGGSSATGSLPSAREDGGTLFASTALGPALVLTASGQVTATRAGEDPVRLLPATQTLAAGGALSATELWRRLQLLESYAFQSSHDAMSGADTKVHTGQLAASGALSDAVLLGLTAAATRSDLPGGAGQSTALTAALHPTFLLPAWWLTVQPQLAWSSSRVATGTTRALDAQGQLTWNPPWLRSLLALQASGDWTRTELPGASRADTWRVMASLLVNWSLGSAPGALPVSPAGALPAAPANGPSAPARSR